MAIEHPAFQPPSCHTYDVPVAADQNIESLYSEEALRQNAKDSLRFIVGPMPVSEFLRRFLKVDGLKDIRNELIRTSTFAQVPPNPKGLTAEQIYEPLLKALNEHDLCPGFVFRHASGPASTARKLGRTKPHICCYPAEHLSTVENAPATSRPELAHAELFIDVSYNQPHVDYFYDTSSRDRSSTEFLHVFTQDNRGAADYLNAAWGQHISYVTEVFARQHRVFFFTVALSGHYARLFRWDRAGCIVTERFDIRTHPALLCDFLRRVSRTSNIGRGHDTTVGAATVEEEAAFRDAITQHVKTQLGVEGVELEKGVTEHYLPGCVSAMHVLQQGAVAEPETVRRYLVSRPVISPLFLDGRGTRGFWAVDASTNQVAFLKDTWRLTGYPLEGDVLEEMNAKGVRNIPSLSCHGEVPDLLPIDRRRRFEFNEIQSTQTDEYCCDWFACLVKGQTVSLAKLVHYRVVLGTVGYSLKHLKGTEELLHATFDVLQAMADARKKDSRIHRDLSMGNILLVAEEGRTSRRGYLIDWDASCEVDDTGASVHRDRPGTWEYMSLAMIDDGDSGADKAHRQTLEDDMESLLYVIIHCGLLWLPHDLTDAELDATIAMFFTSRNVALADTAAIREEAKARGIRPMEIGCGLKDWLYDLLDHFSGFELEEDDAEGEDGKEPAGGEKDEQPPKGEQHEWNIENLEKFWEDFLRTHTLGKNDRVVHNHPRATGTLAGADKEAAPARETVSAAAPSDTTPSLSSIAKGKRRAEEPEPTSRDPDTPAQPDPKRARLEDAPSSSSSSSLSAVKAVPQVVTSASLGTSSADTSASPGKPTKPEDERPSAKEEVSTADGRPVREALHQCKVPASPSTPIPVPSSAVLGKRGAEERDPPQPGSLPDEVGAPEQKRFRLDGPRAETTSGSTPASSSGKPA